MDRNAINDAIFKKVLQESKHSKQFRDEKPKFTVCIKASDMRIKNTETKRDYKRMPQLLQNLIYLLQGCSY